MERILKGWNFVRLVRLVLGLYITVQSVLTAEWILGIAGSFLTGMALWNLGCCDMYSCYHDIKSNPELVKEIIYEEVDAQK
jgi:hypothetical protein